MAYCQTTRWVSTSPYVKLTVTEDTSAATATTAKLSWKLEYISDYAASTSSARAYTVKIAGETVKTGTFDINGKTGTKEIASGSVTGVARGTAAKSIAFSASFAFNLTWSGSYKGTLTASGSISIAAKTSYTIKYNANGGSGAPSSQTKWYGTNITLSSETPKRSGYTFMGWGTSSSTSTRSYSPGDTYSSNASITLYAIWTATTYIIMFHANGGSGGPTGQSKTHGVDLTLSSSTPTRTNYTFKGWGTSASATTVSYAAGAKYTKNASIDLYAVWGQSYTKPKISGLSVTRCDYYKNEIEDGTYALVDFSWKTEVSAKSIVFEYKLASSASWTSLETRSISGTSGTFFDRVGGSFSADNTYNIRITVKDSSGNTAVTRNLPAVQFPIDMKQDGVSIGKPATESNLFDVGWSARFDDDTFVGVTKQWEDGLPGTKLSRLGGIVIQRDSSVENPNPYLDFRLQGTTNKYDCRIMYYKDTKSLKFLGAEDVYFNAKGQEVCPYFSKNDSTIIVTWAGAGYCSSSKENIYFSIPLSKPVVGNPTISIGSVNGFKLRLNNAYTHGSGSETWVTPKSYGTPTLTPAGYLNITATMNLTDNAINNTPIGVQWSGTITFK